MSFFRRSGRFAAVLSCTALLAAPLPALADAGHSHGAAIGQPGEASAATRTVPVILGDNYFEPSSIAVQAGETVRFVLTNSGQLLHEFNIGTAAMHAEHRQEMATMMEHGMLTPTGINHEMMKMDHGHMGGHAAGHAGMQPMAHDDPNSVLVEPGETKELVWTFARPAELQFACNIPGHTEAGMVGDIRFGR